MASTATRNSDSGVRSAVEEASGYALVLNQLFSHTRKIRPRKVLKSLTLFKLFTRFNCALSTAIPAE